MVQTITDNLGLIILIVLAAAITAAYYFTESPETSRDNRSNSDKITDQLQAREELKYRSEADNKAEIEYIKKYYENKKNETIF